MLAKEAFRHIHYQKFSCVVASLCVFLVVFAATMLSSLSSYASIVITRLAELQVGESDVLVSSRSAAGFLNFTAMKRTIEETTDTVSKEGLNVNKSLSPRLGFRVSVQALVCKQEPTSRGTCRENHNYTGEVVPARLILYDHGIEREAQIGKLWPHPKLQTGHVYMKAGLCQRLRISEGDYVGLSVHIGTLLAQVFRRSVNAKDSVVVVPVRIRKAVESLHGKFPVISSTEDEDEEVAGVFGELSLFLRDAVGFANLSSPDVKKLQKHRLQETVSTMVIRIPKQRASVYYNSDFATMQRQVVHFATAVLRDMSLDSLKVSLPLLKKLDEYKFLNLFIGLVIQVVIFVFAFLCFILLYSHMLFAVESRSTEMGTLRLLGLTRGGVAWMTLTEMLIIAIPSWGLALFAAQFSFRTFANAANERFGTSLPELISASSIVMACVVGLALPVLASLLPVRKAMTSRPLDAFSWRTSRISAVVISKRKNDILGSPGLMIAASLMTFYGIIIFNIFPKAIIKMDLKSLVYLFEVFIISILFGMVLFLTNFDLQTSVALKKALFFYERQSVRRISRLNLITHRRRNRRTFLMYSISVALVVYIETSLQLQLETVLTIMRFHTGATYRVSPRTSGDSKAFDCCKQNLEEISSLPGVKSFTWVSESIPKFLPKDASMTNLGGAFSTPLHAQAVLPSYLGSTYKGIYRGSMKSRGSWNNVDVYEELYTIKGSQSIVVHDGMRRVLGLRGPRSPVAARVVYTRNNAPDATTEYQTRPQTVKEGSSILSVSAEFSGLPGFHKNKYSKHQPSLVSFPTFTRLIGGRYPYVDKLPLDVFLLQVDTNSVTSSNLADIGQALGKIKGPRLDVESVEETTESIAAASTIMRIGFLGINALVQTVCFFALLTGMIANARESRKETAVLRAIGIREHVLIRIVLAEALSLLMGASVVGIATGWGVSHVQHYQQNLFLDLNSTIHVPWVTFATTFVISLMSSIISAVLSSRLGRRSITTDLSKV